MTFRISANRGTNDSVIDALLLWCAKTEGSEAVQVALS